MAVHKDMLTIRALWSPGCEGIIKQDDDSIRCARSSSSDGKTIVKVTGWRQINLIDDGSMQSFTAGLP